MEPNNGKLEAEVQRRYLDIQAQLLTIWKDVFGDVEINNDATFTDLGGHSLLAVRVTNKIRSRLGSELPLWVLFSEEGSINGIAKIIQSEETIETG